MIDIHTHILPVVDDGSQSVEESLKLLRMQREQGVTDVVFTPHFYAHQNSPEVFLKRRTQAFEKLKPALTPDLPKIYLGAEVQYFEGICNVEDLNRLCIGGDRLLLLEMPFSKWSSRAVDDAIELNERYNMQVILAHIERYFQFAQPEMWRDLRAHGVLMQSNATFFLDKKTRKKALSMYRKGEVNFVASDCHNLTTRKPNLGQAMDLIREQNM